MEKKSITKWLLSLDEHRQLVITEKEVSKFAPINRVLEKPGFYQVDSVLVDDQRYLIVYEPKEEYEVKTKMLVSKIHSEVERVIDMTSKDQENVLRIAEKLMNVQSYQN